MALEVAKMRGSRLSSMVTCTEAGVDEVCKYIDAKASSPHRPTDCAKDDPKGGVTRDQGGLRFQVGPHGSARR
jgi:hypothetical protein